MPFSIKQELVAMPEMLALLSRAWEGQNLLGRSRALQAGRQRRLVRTLLFVGLLALTCLGLALLGLQMAPLRFVGVLVASGALGLVLLALRAKRLVLASVLMVWGITAAVGVQAWVAGGLEVPGLFLLPALLMLSAGLLGQGPTLALLVTMLALVLALGLPWVGAMPGGMEPLGPMPSGYRAVVMAFLLVLTYIGLQVFVRTHRRDVNAIQALNERLSSAFDELKLRQEALLAAQHEVEAFNQVLERRVQARTAELSSSLEQLKETQRELVQAEKMAALGSLVAGVAHELHRPLQQGLSGVSTAQSVAASVQARLRSGQTFRKSELEQWVQQCHDNADLALTALQRCQSLVENFKSVAADQRTLTRRSFELEPMLERLAEALRPTLSEGVILDLAVEPGLRMDSYPGALDQIVIELVRNAAAHGFRDGRTGCIRLTVNTLGTDVVDLRCIDDGEGLTPTMQHRVFEPFFSTRLGQGGAGLGLAVAYGLAVHVLQGSLNVTCTPTEGTCFRLLVPRVVVGGQVERLQAAA